ncbi:amphi-Trp domain-containing protein [Streptomyces sp. P17]|uniref:amphi-Trp domain-containing protein n=1 Tax=Streptomyces sp. P17 TaxID=3074716 RepID=UPI0028F3FF2A|nr:amphi-Trp domain-containing protein [Streptomyces sp. P17]MDT9697488.1 amphi-Trp domain-containing protein [Streptomyces sp. P17]
MSDLRIEQKRSLSRLEAADQLAALASALRQGEDAELELEPWTLSLRIPSELHSEIELEVGDGEIELEIELKWPTTTPTPPTTPEAGAAKRTTAKRTTAKKARA